MKAILFMALFISFSSFSSEIENGKLEISLNGKVFSTSLCDTYTDGDYVGIKIKLSEGLLLTEELSLKGARVLSKANPLKVVKNTDGPISATGLCGSQNQLSDLQTTYSKSDLETKITYAFRCNQKISTRTITCTK